jgi:hypothetical protein
MSIPKAAGKVPDAVAGTPVQVIKGEPRLWCPQENCGFHYWNTANRQGKRTPTVQDKFSARDEPCEHFYGKWTPASGEPLETTLEDAARSASEIFCVVDKQVPLEEDAQLVVIYVDQQTTLGGF